MRRLIIIFHYRTICAPDFTPQTEKHPMKSRFTLMLAVVALFGLAGNASAAEDIVSMVKQGCAAEIENYCSQVTLGEGRLLACFYAHEDKLSGQCQYAVYDASAQLERAVSALNYLASQCEDDMVAHCARVQMGEGRVIECLQANSESISAKCNQAMADVID
jgi:hypothetical protein